jgi:predicted HAD superfamily Cof-like phosphohydrolase
MIVVYLKWGEVMTQQSKNVQRFLRELNIEIPLHARLPENSEMWLHSIERSVKQLEHATKKSKDPIAMTAALAELMYMCQAMAYAGGLPLQYASGVIHKSQMSRFDEHGRITVDAKGRIQKGPNYNDPYEKIEEYINEES